MGFVSDRLPTSPSPVQVALIGAGKWGQRLGAAIARQPALRLRSVCDRDPAALVPLAAPISAAPSSLSPATGTSSDVPGPALTTSLEEVLADPQVEAVVVAVSPSENGEVALRALEEGKHVLVEKPFATSLELGQRIARAAEARGLVAGVGHVLRYQPVFGAMERLLAAGDLGAPWGFLAQRLGSHRRRELSPWWVLAPHDLSLAAAWFGGAARTVRVTEGQLVDARLGFSEGTFGRILLGAHPERTRETLLLTARGVIRVNEGGPECSAELYRLPADAVDAARVRLLERLHEPFAAMRAEVERLLGQAEQSPLPVQPGDALQAELLAFSRAVRNGAAMPTSVRASLPVLEMLVLGEATVDRMPSTLRDDERVTAPATRLAYDGFA